MGLLDVLNGMQNGPHGQRAPSTSTSGSGGMSPITMAILGLFAYKAVKTFTGAQPAANPARPGALPGGGTINTGRPGSGGGLGDLLQSGLGGLFAGRGAGNVLSGGLN